MVRGACAYDGNDAFFIAAETAGGTYNIALYVYLLNAEKLLECSRYFFLYIGAAYACAVEGDGLHLLLLRVPLQLATQHLQYILRCLQTGVDTAGIELNGFAAILQQAPVGFSRAAFGDE